MVAPGKNLDFSEGSAFKERITDFPELRDAIFTHLRTWPNAGREVCGGMKSLNLVFTGRTFEILFRRIGQRMAVLDAFEIPGQEKQRQEALELLREIYCKQPDRGVV